VDYPVLEGLPLKVARAERHIAEVEAGMMAYLDGRTEAGSPYITSGQFDRATSEYVISAVIQHEPPPGLGLVLAEAAHALRSSLDHLVWDLVRLRGNEPTRRTQFPVFLDEPGFNQKSPPMVEGLSTTDKDTIRSLQPFIVNPAAPAETPLAVLSWIDNTDKHRLIHATLPVVSAAYFPGTPDADGYYESPLQLAWTDFGRNNDTGQITRLRVRRPTLALGEPQEVIRIGLLPAGPNPMMTLATPRPTLLFGDQNIYLGQLNTAKTVVREIFDWFRPEFDS
jgi:hypothetical protein